MQNFIDSVRARQAHCPSNRVPYLDCSAWRGELSPEAHDAVECGEGRDRLVRKTDARRGEQRPDAENAESEQGQL